MLVSVLRLPYMQPLDPPLSSAEYEAMERDTAKSSQLGLGL